MRPTNCSSPAKFLRFSRVAFTLGSCLVLAACSDDVASPRPLAAGDLKGSVTPELASRLGPDGRFVFPPAPSEVYEQLSPEEAADVAVAWARTYGKYSLNEFERLHGKAIDFNKLRVGSPAYYAAPAYEPVPANVALGIRSAFGPQYLIYLVDDEGPVVSIAVAAFSEARVQNGRLDLSSSGGMEVVPDPVGQGRGFEFPVSPEQAATVASHATGARVAAVPELMMPGKGYHPQHARWRVVLDRPVNPRAQSGGAAGAEHATREVYVGLRGHLATPSRAQPAGASIFDPVLKESIPLVRRASRPTSFDRVTFPNR